MSITFHIAAATDAEHRALDLEGAPTLNVTNSNAAWIQHVLGLTPTPDGDIDPAELLDRIDAATDPPDYLARRLPLLADIARAAARLGRHVAWT